MRKVLNAERLDGSIKALQLIVRAGGISNARNMSESTGDAVVANVLKSMSTDSLDTQGMANQAFDDLLVLASRQSLIGKIDAAQPFRHLPENTRYLTQLGGGNASFVGEALPISVSDQSLSTDRLQCKRVCALQIYTDELVKNLDAGRVFAGDLVRLVADAESAAFIGTDAAGVAPAGILHGVSVAQGGSDARDDLESLLAAFEGDLGRSVVVASPAAAVRLARYYQGAAVANGDVAGLPLVTHHAVPANTLVVLQPDRIAFNDGGMSVEQSKEAIVYTDADEPISVFQQNLVAFRALRWVDWKPSIDAVAAITGNWS
ncbi:MAG: hypothetical protein GXZ05_12850 [Gammaproteobacteria bacterium]|nr:hypothetical protein [Gammaproteobacteria bacterium]